MRDADLDDAAARTAELDHQLRAHHRADALQIEIHQRVATEELESAIDVPDRNVEEDAHEVVPDSRREPARPPVLSVDAVSGHDVHPVDPGQERLELVDVELEVRVGEEDEVHGRRAEASEQRFAVSAVLPVLDEPDVRILLAERPDDLRRPVGRAVVDHHDLEVAAQPGRRAPGPLDGLRDVALLVSSGENDGQSVALGHVGGPAFASG